MKEFDNHQGFHHTEAGAELVLQVPDAEIAISDRQSEVNVISTVSAHYAFPGCSKV